MRPFSCPEKIFVCASPCDMRAGINRLVLKVQADFGRDPADGALYVFVSRDCRRIKMLCFDEDGWIMWSMRPSKGTFRWSHAQDGRGCLECARYELGWMVRTGASNSI